MENLSSHQFEEVYRMLGIDTQKLGCIMLDLEPIELSPLIDADHLYRADDSERYEFVDGIVAEEKAHVTLLYGLMHSGKTIKEHVSAVLDGWYIDAVSIMKIGYFESKVPTEPYYCLIAHIDPTGLIEANARLRFLPHIDTFPEYRPHVTLAYIKKDETIRDYYLELLNSRFAGDVVAATGIDFGK